MEDPTGEVFDCTGRIGAGGRHYRQNSYWRNVYALRAYRQTPFARVIVSGGGQFHPADSMRDFLAASGIPSDRITVEDRSVSTRENAVYTKIRGK
ncbi:MAG TPA: YdcF family protein [Bryobacteraceae bacterium]